jgi:L-cysteine/cystine lyase
VVVETAMAPKLTRLRDQLPAVGTTGYFNAGANGPLPRVAHEALVAAAAAELEAGRIVPGRFDRNRLANRQVAALIAELFGADADEIALTRSTSEGLATFLMGLTWRRGDEVVSTRRGRPERSCPCARSPAWPGGRGCC